MFKSSVKGVFKCLVGLFLIHSTSSSQTLQDSLNIKISHASYAEKVYLQLDNTVYYSTETIWFKAVVVGAQNHVPSKLSGILYVELIDPYKQIIDTQKLKLNNGVATGYFTLQNYESGQYLIRAYTNWNKNFEQDFMFNQYIQIYESKEKVDPIKSFTLTKIEEETFNLSAQLDPLLLDPKYRGKLKVYLTLDEKEDSIEVKKDKTGLYNVDYLLSQKTKQLTLKFQLDNFKSFSKTIAADKDYLDLRFFPEGGELVSGLRSTLGLKAIDYAGKGKQVVGTIVDDQEQVINAFKSNYLGMGKIQLIPEANKQYYAHIKGSQGDIFKYPLPKVSSNGLVMHVSADNKKINLNVKSKKKFDDYISIRVRHRGVTRYYSYIKVRNNTFNKQFDNVLLPEGILEFTIFNNGTPICERLFFNYKHEEQLNISVKPNRSIYGQRDKTKLDIQILDSNNNPVNASASVLVLNKVQLGKMQASRQNIRSFLLLSSEIKGEIEDPGYYFKGEAKHEDMDALMLTQGWRKYNYKNDKGLFLNKPETTLSVTGSIGEVINAKKRDKSVELTMMTFGDPVNFHKQEVDSTGFFNFNLGEVYGDNLKVVIQTKNKKGKQKDYTINIDKATVPYVIFNPQKKIEVLDTLRDAYLNKIIKREQAVEDFELSQGTVELDEVILMGYKLTPEREKMMELHGKPDVVIENKELVSKVKKWSYGLYSVLLFSYPEELEVRRVGRGGGFLYANVYGADFTFILVDGILVNLDEYRIIESLPPEEIKSFEILKNPKNALKIFSELFPPPASPEERSFSIISIYTYSGKGLYSIQRTPGISKNTIPVFSEPREFYAPKHENLTTQDWKNPDLRSLIHWAPNFVTDKEGNAEIEFYNADDIGDMLVVVETITSDGRIGYHEITYVVEEKLEK